MTQIQAEAREHQGQRLETVTKPEGHHCPPGWGYSWRLTKHPRGPDRELERGRGTPPPHHPRAQPPPTRLSPQSHTSVLRPRHPGSELSGPTHCGHTQTWGFSKALTSHPSMPEPSWPPHAPGFPYPFSWAPYTCYEGAPWVFPD